VLLMPGLTVVAYALMRALGELLPEPHLAIPAVPGMFLGFFVLALTEALGWSAYATERVQERWSALQAGILLGLVGGRSGRSTAERVVAAAQAAASRSAERASRLPGG
jgi:membrane protease YdiL (CAAX protease family)